MCLLETLQTQTESLERARLRHLRSQEDRRSTEMPTQAQPTQPVSVFCVCVLSLAHAYVPALCPHTVCAFYLPITWLV